MNLLQVIVCLVLFQQTLSAAIQTTGTLDEENLKSLHFLGSIQLENGALVKQYWADNETRSWNESRLFCEGIGSEFFLSTMKTEREVEILREAYSNTTFFGTHWVSAALANPLIMSWVDASNDTIEDILPWDNPPAPTTSICAGFHSNGTRSYLRALDCSFLERVICVRVEHHNITDEPTKNQQVNVDYDYSDDNTDVLSILEDNYLVGGISKSLSYLGTIEVDNGELSKQYWADDVVRSWINGQLFCESIGTGFSLATMKSEEEVEILRAAYNSATFSGTYWMSAVLAEPERSMAWVDEENDIIGDIGLSWNNSVTLAICGAYHSMGRPSYFRALDCTLNHKIICVLTERRYAPTTTEDPITTTEWIAN